MADMIVSGAEYSAANATYVESGTNDGKPRYVHESNSDYAILWDNVDAAWYVYDAVNLTWGYYSLSEVATPDLCSSWADGFTYEPSSLTVTAAPSGTTHEGEVALSSLSYLRTKKA